MRVAVAYRFFEYEILIPVDAAFVYRLGLQRLTHFRLTIDGVAADHARRLRRIERGQQNRIAEHLATRLVAHRYRILTVFEVEEVFRSRINRRYRYRVVERRIARRQNRDATVGQFAGRRVFAVDALDDRRRADEHEVADRAALATVFLLIYIINMVACLAVHRQRVAHIIRIARTFRGLEPLEFRAGLLADRIQQDIFRFRTDTVETAVRERRRHRRFGVSQGHRLDRRVARVDIAYLNLIIAGFQVRQERVGAEGLTAVVTVFERRRTRRCIDRNAAVGRAAQRRVHRRERHVRIRMNRRRYHVRRIRIRLHALAYHAVHVNEALNLVTRIEYDIQRIAAIGVTVIIAVAVSAAVHTPFVHLDGRTDIGMRLERDGLARTSFAGVSRDFEPYIFYNVERDDRRGVDRVAVAGRDHAVTRIVVGRIHLGYIQRAAGRITVATAFRQFVPTLRRFVELLPTELEVNALGHHRQRSRRIVAGIDILVTRLYRRGRQNRHRHLVGNRATVFRKERDRISRGLARRGHRIRHRRIGQAGFRTPMDGVGQIGHHLEPDRNVLADGGVFREAYDSRHRPNFQHTRIGRHDFLNRTFVRRRYLAENRAAAVHREFLRFIDRVDGTRHRRAVHIPLIGWRVTRVSVLGRRDAELLAVAKRERAAQLGFRQHPFVGRHVDGLLDRRYTVEDRNRIDRTTYGRHNLDLVHRIGNRGQNARRIGRRSRERIMVFARAAVRIALQRHRIVFADDELLVRIRGQRTAEHVDLDTVVTRTAVGVFRHIQMIPYRRGHTYRTFDKRLARSDQFVGRRPPVGQVAVVLVFGIGRHHRIGIDPNRELALAVVHVDGRQTTDDGLEDVRRRRVPVGTLGAVVDEHLHLVVRPQYGRERRFRTALFLDPVQEPVDRGPGLERVVGRHLERHLVAGTNRFRRHERNRRVQVTDVLDNELGVAVGIIRRIGINRIVGLGFRHDAHDAATVAVAVHTLVDRQVRVHAVFVAAHAERIRVHAIVRRKGPRKRIGQVLPAFAVVLIHLPLILQIDARSRNLESGRRAVADRHALGMLDEARIRHDIDPGRIADATTPRFVNHDFITRMDARADLDRVVAVGHRRQIGQRRPRIGGLVAAARHADFDALAGQDILVGRDVDFRLVNNLYPDLVRRLRFIVDTTQARIQIHIDFVAVHQILTDIVAAGLHRIAVSVPDEYRIVAGVDRGLGKPDRQTLARADRIHVRGNVGRHLNVHALVEFHLHRDGVGNKRTGRNAFQTGIDRHTHFVAVVEAVYRYGRRVGHTRQRVAVQPPFEMRRVGVEAVAPAVTVHFERHGRAFADIEARQYRIYRSVNRFNRFGADILDRRRPTVFVAGATRVHEFDLILAHHALVEVRANRIRLGRGPAARTLPHEFAARYGVGAEEERIFRTDERIGINMYRRRIAGHRLLDETVGNTTGESGHEFRSGLRLQETVGNTAQISRYEPYRAVFGNKTVVEAAEILRLQIHLAGLGKETVGQTAEILRLQNKWTLLARQTVGNATQILRNQHKRTLFGYKTVVITAQILRNKNERTLFAIVTVSDTAEVLRLHDERALLAIVTVGNATQVLRLKNKRTLFPDITVSDTAHILRLDDERALLAAEAVGNTAEVLPLVFGFGLRGTVAVGQTAHILPLDFRLERSGNRRVAETALALGQHLFFGVERTHRLDTAAETAEIRPGAVFILVAGSRRHRQGGGRFGHRRHNFGRRCGRHYRFRRQQLRRRFLCRQTNFLRALTRTRISRRLRTRGYLGERISRQGHRQRGANPDQNGQAETPYGMLPVHPYSILSFLQVLSPRPVYQTHQACPVHPALPVCPARSRPSSEHPVS